MFTKCPICDKKFWKRSIKLHIINAAKDEAYRSVMNLLKYAKNKPYQFSPAVMTRQMPHVAFIRRNMKTKQLFEIDIR